MIIKEMFHITVHFGKAVSEKKIFRNRPIENKNCLWQPCLLMDQNKMSNVYRGPSIDASYQVSYHLAKRFQRKSCFRNRPIRNKNCLRNCFAKMSRYLVGNTYGRFCIKFPQSRMKGERHSLSSVLSL
jgi:hypothetical protein